MLTFDDPKKTFLNKAALSETNKILQKNRELQRLDITKAYCTINTHILYISTYLRINSFSGTIKGLRGGQRTQSPDWPGASVLPEDWLSASSGCGFFPPPAWAGLCSRFACSSPPAQSPSFSSSNICCAILESAVQDRNLYIWRQAKYTNEQTHSSKGLLCKLTHAFTTVMVSISTRIMASNIMEMLVVGLRKIVWATTA